MREHNTFSAPRRVSHQFITYWLGHPTPGKKVDLWTDPRILNGKFYARYGKLWVAIDNCGGEFFTEEFRRMKDAIGWLNDPERRTGDDYKKEVLHQRIGGGHK